MINYQLMDEILKQLEDIKVQVNNAEDAYGRIVKEECWEQLFVKIRKLIKLDSGE
jgi:hypothetical protein